MSTSRTVSPATSPADLLSELDRVCLEVIDVHAADVDRGARFPADSLAALRRLGMLGLTSAHEIGGGGQGLRTAGLVVERLARSCASTAMVVTMHYAAVAVIEKVASAAVREAVARGDRLLTLALSEAGSRSQFWAPVGTAAAERGAIRLDAHKSFVTAAGHADLIVWSSRPVAAEGASTLWLLPRLSAGLTSPRPFEGLGLRGNDSAPIDAAGVVIAEETRLGADGGGFAIMIETILPVFNILSSACSLGLMEAALRGTAAHASATRFEQSGASLAELPTVRAHIARMRVQTDLARALWLDTLTAIETARPDAVLRVLECKAAAAEAATSVTETAMRVCGGAAFRRDLAIERLFRDAQAATLMAPTTDTLYDFIGKAACGLPLF